MLRLPAVPWPGACLWSLSPNCRLCVASDRVCGSASSVASVSVVLASLVLQHWSCCIPSLGAPAAGSSKLGPES
ncbi:uncharacterized protein ASCRUDRAFT_73443 [Ascoidea rubescens DSM 1968]|uniref:Uncharacterized protein n=1 Tax=Ascoidea rubescens DSM 1968 TaxID=1344418 RepID=A0A1D2VPX3_9ASCO|nr:hypothetical protein ASCRUDRAFT_73443 [Ascoidea rubescens DSM 1968]ODV63634.1 hypothetical protein ASCRUDRAFT_73443 [Ascoidea rubescens DSM 1968]